MPNTHHTALLWVRRDLRLADNPALRHALSEAQQVIPVYIHAPEEEAPWVLGAASQWWLHHSLTALSESIEKRGSRLLVRSGDSLKVLQQLIKETGATLVCWNRLYEPAVIARDTHIKQVLKDQGLTVSSHNAALLFEPWTIRNQQDKPFRVFTPFWRHCQKQLAQQPALLAAPKRLPQVPATLASQPIVKLQLLPSIPWDSGFKQQWRPGEAGAQQHLQRFVDQGVQDYSSERDRPDHHGTSCLSPHLHFGEISPRQIVTALAESSTAESYVREIGWREFAHHLLYHFPHTVDKPLDARFENFQWQKNKAGLKAWQRGMTGIPLVDAGMRELWHTGWMHNRVRMIVASFLTKNLRIHWLEGARWFWDTLVDADLAANTLGWQWTAGCGADAAPYFRVFNPVLQAERFDPQCAYIRNWVPELAALPDKWIAKPWTAPETELLRAKITLGKIYPKPIVDLSVSREQALAAYGEMKEVTNS
ncbi:MAG: deoxyribodipyrimidine photo-lyase [Steroidobacteraceae bacterium]